jgi:uncharacterized membrane protein
MIQAQGIKTMSESNIEGKQSAFDPADITALSHLYRGELYRSTVWRTRLDATTNWAVLTTGIALSLTFSSESASPLPLVLVGLLVTTFLFIEARRYRFFDFWRMRAHILEEILYQDYRAPNLHISYAEAVGRRLRHNYSWIFAIQVTAYVGKLLIHPAPVASLQEFWIRAAIGPVPGQFVLVAGLAFHATWIMIAIATYRSRRGAGRARPQYPKRDRLLDLARG